MDKEKKRKFHLMLYGIAIPVSLFALYTFVFVFDVSVGRFSPFRVGLKTPISVNLKSPMHHVCY